MLKSIGGGTVKHYQQESRLIVDHFAFTRRCCRSCFKTLTYLTVIFALGILAIYTGNLENVVAAGLEGRDLGQSIDAVDKARLARGMQDLNAQGRVMFSS